MPGGVDRHIPGPGPDPYPRDASRRCIFAGNVYGDGNQAEANRTLVDKLNHLGRHLASAGIRLYLLGKGDTSRLDAAWVTHLGAVSLDASWDYLIHADAGVVVSAGPFIGSEAFKENVDPLVLFKADVEHLKKKIQWCFEGHEQELLGYARRYKHENSWTRSAAILAGRYSKLLNPGLPVRTDPEAPESQ